MRKTPKKDWIVEKRFSDIRKDGLTEAICAHGIGHHKGVHGCDGCCSSVPDEIWSQVTVEKIITN